MKLVEGALQVHRSEWKEILCHRVPPTRDTGSTQDGDHAALGEADATTEECNQVAAAIPEAPAHPSDLKQGRIFQEELPLLREKERETGQVDLLTVGPHLREIGVEGDIPEPTPR